MKHLRDFGRIVLIVILISSMFLISGCKKKEPEVIKIGAILPLTGSIAIIGVPEKKCDDCCSRTD